MRRGESRLPLLVFLGATGLVLFLLVALARYPTLLQRGAEYHTTFRGVAGLNLGDDVRYGGLLVGAISGMRLDPEDDTRVRVSFRVSGNTPMRADTRAEITQIGMLGQQYLNLIPGAQESPPLPPGQMVLSADNMTFGDAMTRLGQFMNRADSLLAMTERLTGSPVDRFENTMVRLDSLVTTAGNATARALESLDQLTLQMAAVLNRTERVMASVDTTLSGARPEIAATQREAMQTMRELRGLVEELRQATERGERVESIVRGLASTTDNLERLTDRLERDPSSVLRRRATAAKPAGPTP